VGGTTVGVGVVGVGVVGVGVVGVGVATTGTVAVVMVAGWYGNARAVVSDAAICVMGVGPAALPSTIGDRVIQPAINSDSGNSARHPSKIIFVEDTPGIGI
jgi:hypothetical protein